MASAIPVASVRGDGEKPKSRRLGGLLDLSHRTPLISKKQKPQKEAERNVHTMPEKFQSRVPARLHQGLSTHQLSTSTEPRPARPPLTLETQSLSSNSNSRSVLPAAKPRTATTCDAEPNKQKRSLLHRKTSIIFKEPSNTTPAQTHPHSEPQRTTASPTSQTTTHQISSMLDQRTTKTPGENRITQKSAIHPLITQPPARIYPELDRYRAVQMPASRDLLGRDALHKLETEDLPPPTPQFSVASSHSQLSSFSGSPSTGFSGSPGPGPYSRDTTPTSMCSQSPGFVAPMRSPMTRVRQASPAETRPLVTRRRTDSVSNDESSFSSESQRLSSVRETLTSSSSTSTVRAEETKDSKTHRGRAQVPPNPPPRKSSQTANTGRNAVETQSVKLSQITTRPLMRSPSPIKATGSVHSRLPSSTSSLQRRPALPFRPSRDKTPVLDTQFGGQAPVIHSNLSSSSLTERSQSGQLQPSSLPRTMTQGSGRENTTSKLPSFSREPVSIPQSSAVASTHITTKSDTKKPCRASSPSVPITKSKFSLFGRRTKSGPEVAQTEKKEKPSRKGPAAGTGHEGYGRVGAVKRRSSSTASTVQRGPPGRVSSSDSLTGTASTDQFLLDRMNPVIIAGGTVVENQNNSDSASAENTDVSRNRHSRQLSAVSPGTKENSRHDLWPSPLPRETTHSRRPSVDNGSDGITMKPTLAYRRSSRELPSQHSSSFSVTRPMNIRSESVASTATTICTDVSSPGVNPELESERYRLLPQSEVPAEKPTKKVKTPRKWNLFGRSQATSAKKQAKSVPVTVESTRKTATAFYTLIDSSEPDSADGRQEMGTIRRGAETPSTIRQAPRDRETSISSSTTQVAHVHPGKETANISKSSDTVPNSSQMDATQDQPPAEKSATEITGTRTRRYPQIPMVPKLTTSQLEQMSPKSFSRPFNQITIPPVSCQPIQPDHNSIADNHTRTESETSRAIYTESPVSRVQSRLALGQTSRGASPDFESPVREFLTFPCHKKSSHTETESPASVGSEIFRYDPHIAQIPEPSAPLGEDEIWDEFDDLFWDSPLSSSVSSCCVPSPLEIYRPGVDNMLAKPLQSPSLTAEFIRQARLSVATASSHNTADLIARIDAAFGFDSDLPVTSMSESESESKTNYDGHKSESEREPNAFLRDKSSLNEVNVESKRSSEDSNRSSESIRLDEETPLAQVNLRVGSMTVSKWLTFGHVLFSPVREDLSSSSNESKDRQSILVIDGLGNDDWSFYVAETYPAANFYNLSPRAPILKEHQTVPAFPLAPPNHHQIQFPSYADKFPFGPDSFTALVFRFPSAAPEAHYRNIISEARRVLKPGGFIELSVLDVDLNNVGNRTRRAVRSLKEQIAIQNSDFYLSSTADIMLRLLGVAGFVDIKSCRVGVPVASTLTDTNKIQNNKEKGKNKKGGNDEQSLAEMLSDETELGDENITKMVSRVGRWWYNRCYETTCPGISGGGKSVWHDRRLLAECEEWGTSLKLMVCYARVPENKGRIASI